MPEPLDTWTKTSEAAKYLAVDAQLLRTSFYKRGWLERRGSAALGYEFRYRSEAHKEMLLSYLTGETFTYRSTVAKQAHRDRLKRRAKYGKHVPSQASASSADIAWAKGENEKQSHRCICGCEILITVAPAHRKEGIPKFVMGHNPKSEVEKFILDNGGKLRVPAKNSKGYKLANREEERRKIFRAKEEPHEPTPPTPVPVGGTLRERKQALDDELTRLRASRPELGVYELLDTSAKNVGLGSRTTAVRVAELLAAGREDLIKEVDDGTLTITAAHNIINHTPSPCSVAVRERELTNLQNSLNSLTNAHGREAVMETISDYLKGLGDMSFLMIGDAVEQPTEGMDQALSNIVIPILAEAKSEDIDGMNRAALLGEVHRLFGAVIPPQSLRLFVNGATVIGRFDSVREALEAVPKELKMRSGTKVSVLQKIESFEVELQPVFVKADK